MEYRCHVCGNLLIRRNACSNDPRVSECCSEECARIYFGETGEEGEEEEGEEKEEE